MYNKIATGFLFLVLTAIPVFSQSPTTENFAASSNKADGLELPADQTVKYDEGFITIKATCKGTVKWLVISSLKIKYFTLPDNSLVVSVPPQSGNISIFAVGLVDNKLTDFARTNITITGGGPMPPNPPSPPNPSGGPYHFTFVVDLNNTTPELAQVLNSQTIDQAIKSKGSFRRVYDIKSPTLKDKRLDTVIQQVGGNTVMIVQNSAGQVVDKRVMPKTEAEVLQVVNNILGGQ